MCCVFAKQGHRRIGTKIQKWSSQRSPGICNSENSLTTDTTEEIEVETTGMSPRCCLLSVVFGFTFSFGNANFLDLK
ncbi:hypothetical protein ANANG_G00100240 [Anguilla anguilla]|uniref:Uncharacterized protein n=1 Tax=Anguilla anguilla TaxID=7936 RepID=A0A9D3MGQ7_ANGAN|nr:hypothetical protein ANANG_G00100240 [Anguilla anguilla]